MSRARQIFKSVFLVLYLLAIHALAALFIFDRFIAGYIFPDISSIAEVKAPTEETPIPTPLPVPSIIEENSNAFETNTLVPNTNQAAATNQVSNQSPNQNIPPNPSDLFLIPVHGVKSEQLLDTFSDSRSEGRFHDAIDIPAPQGTPVVATANGEIAKFFDSEAGGITIYQYSADKKYVYYYAHLQKRAENIKEKDFVRQGTVIGYVGDTGNAGAGNFHLHFSIALLSDPNRYWEGSYINPFPLLRNGLQAP
jgi:peptidoglycan LD-endopeptidase LytH